MDQPDETVTRQHFIICRSNQIFQNIAVERNLRTILSISLIKPLLRYKKFLYRPLVSLIYQICLLENSIAVYQTATDTHTF